MTSLILDTNVLIYSLDQNSNYYDSAVEILTSTSFDFFIPTKVISELFAVSSKLDLPQEIILAFFEELKQNTIILYPNPEYLIHFEQLLAKYRPRGNRVFDMEIAAIALANGISKIATANLSDFASIEEIDVVPLASKA